MRVHVDEVEALAQAQRAKAHVRHGETVRDLVEQHLPRELAARTGRTLVEVSGDRVAHALRGVVAQPGHVHALAAVPAGPDEQRPKAAAHDGDPKARAWRRVAEGPVQLPAMPAERALVTGAAGFIGSHVVDACLRLGLSVVATDDLSGGFRENVSADAAWVEGDLRSADFVRSLWNDGPFDVVYHLGAYAAEGLSHFVRAFNYRNNLEASVNLINQAVAHDVSRFVFTSSIAVYGSGQVPMAEDMAPRPEDPYGIAKYAVELDLAAAARMFGLQYTVFRPHNVYGERQNIADRYRNVIGIFMNNVLRGDPMPVFGDGLQTRAFSHVADVAPAIAQSPFVSASVNETFNIGADEPHSVLELAHAVADALGVEPQIVHLAARDEVVHAFSDHSKFHRVFGQHAGVTLRDGLERMARWVRDHGPQEPVRFSGRIELERGLPPSWREDHPTAAGARNDRSSPAD